jgi:hypothetical protein
MIDEAFLASKTPEERAQAVLDLLDRVDAVLADVSHPLKVLVTMRVAASYSIANQVQLADFLEAADRVFKDTLDDVIAFSKRMKAETLESEAPP